MAFSDVWQKRLIESLRYCFFQCLDALPRYCEQHGQSELETYNCRRCQKITTCLQLDEICLVVPVAQRHGQTEHNRRANRANASCDTRKGFKPTLNRQRACPLSNREELLPLWKRKKARLNHHENPPNRFRCKKLKSTDTGGPNDGFFRDMKGKETIAFSRGYCLLLLVTAY